MHRYEGVLLSRVRTWVLVVAFLALAIGLGASIMAGAKLDYLQRLVRKRTRPRAALGPHTRIFLWPDAWLVVKSRNLFAVQRALSLHSPQPCSWLEGFTNADKLFISPPVKGWILVFGVGLPRPREDVDASFRFVLDLSRKFGQVRFFSADRRLHHHAWVKARKGRILRAYAWAGTTLWHQGNPNPAERELDLSCFDYAEPLQEISSKLDAVADANVEKVPLLAARWGLDPAVVLRRFPFNEYGVTGRAACHYS